MIFHRLLLVQQIYEEDGENIIHDKEYCNLSCVDGETMARIGRHSAECSKACVNAKKKASYWWAIKKTLEQTYLCGDHPCSKVWHNWVHDWKSLLGFIVYLALLPVVIIEMCKLVYSYYSGISFQYPINKMKKKRGEKGGVEDIYLANIKFE